MARDNQVFDVVRTVMAVRQFADRPVPEDVIQRVVEAAHLSASSMNGQPWHFIVVRDRNDLQELGRLVRTGPYNANASFAVIVAYDRKSPYGVSDVSRAIQSMMLTAWAEGVGSNWTGFSGLDGVRDKFGLPASYEVMAVVPFGYPARQLKGKKKRKPLGEVVSAGRFGTPFGK
jgi:nitroreductase